MNQNNITSSPKEVVRAMGIVFGDIGTSPIYTLTIIFFLIPTTRRKYYWCSLHNFLDAYCYCYNSICVARMSLSIKVKVE